MKKVRTGTMVLAFSVALVASAAALAGFKTGQSVVISDSGQFANGDLGYVRNTPDSTEYIGCYNWSNTQAYCFARDANGNSRSCSTTFADFVAVARSLNGDSYLYFQWDSNGQCVFVEVGTGSFTAPKAP